MPASPRHSWPPVRPTAAVYCLPVAAPGVGASSGAAPADAALNLLQRLDLATRRFLEQQPAEGPMGSEALRAWNCFPLHDAHFFPIEYFADLGEKDAIDVVRISPMDATRAFSDRSFEDKVTGETVMHFGAFLKRSWRANDIMWGRLDGVCRILDTLLTPEALINALGRSEVRALLREDLKATLDPAQLFPSAGAAVQRNLREWLTELAHDEPARRAQAAASQANHDLLLWCAQLEILDRELPTVLTDAAREQLQWNHEIVAKGKGASRFRQLESRVDLSCAVIAGAELTQQFIERLKADVRPFHDLRDAPIARHFLSEYKVGAESLRDDIPPAVVLEMLTHALLVARNCLLNAFPDYAPRITSNLVYKTMIHWPLMTAHTLAVLARRERSFYSAMVAALLTYALLALGAATFWPTILQKEGTFDGPRLLALVGVPLLILLPALRGAWLWVSGAWRRSWVGAFLLVLVSGLGVCTTVVLGAAFLSAWTTTRNVLSDWLTRYLGIAEPVTPVAANVALGLLVLLSLLGVPALRGWLQTFVARKVAV